MGFMKKIFGSNTKQRRSFGSAGGGSQNASPNVAAPGGHATPLKAQTPQHLQQHHTPQQQGHQHPHPFSASRPSHGGNGYETPRSAANAIPRHPNTSQQHPHPQQHQAPPAHYHEQHHHEDLAPRHAAKAPPPAAAPAHAEPEKKYMSGSSNESQFSARAQQMMDDDYSSGFDIPSSAPHPHHAPPNHNYHHAPQHHPAPQAAQPQPPPPNPFAEVADYDEVAMDIPADEPSFEAAPAAPHQPPPPAPAPVMQAPPSPPAPAPQQQARAPTPPPSQAETPKKVVPIKASVTLPRSHTIGGSGQPAWIEEAEKKRRQLELKRQASLAATLMQRTEIQSTVVCVLGEIDALSPMVQEVRRQIAERVCGLKTSRSERRQTNFQRYGEEGGDGLTPTAATPTAEDEPPAKRERTSAPGAEPPAPRFQAAAAAAPRAPQQQQPRPLSKAVFKIEDLQADEASAYSPAFPQTPDAPQAPLDRAAWGPASAPFPRPASDDEAASTADTQHVGSDAGAEPPAPAPEAPPAASPPPREPSFVYDVPEGDPFALPMSPPSPAPRAASGALPTSGALADGMLAKLQKKKKDWEDKFSILACRPREQVGDAEQGAGVDFAYVMELYSGKDACAAGEEPQERVHVTGANVKFVQGTVFTVKTTGELNKKGATHFLSTNSVDEARMWLSAFEVVPDVTVDWVGQDGSSLKA